MLWKCSDVACTLRKEGEPSSASPSGEYKMMWAQVLKSLGYLGSGKRTTSQIQPPAVRVCKCMQMVYLFCCKETGLDDVGRTFVKGNGWKCFLKDFLVWQRITLASWTFFSPILSFGNQSYSPISGKDWTKVRRKNIVWDHQNVQDRFPREAVRYHCREVESSAGVQRCAWSRVHQTCSSFENFGAGCFNI